MARNLDWEKSRRYPGPAENAPKTNSEVGRREERELERYFREQEDKKRDAWWAAMAERFGARRVKAIAKRARRQAKP